MTVTGSGSYEKNETLPGLTASSGSTSFTSTETANTRDGDNVLHITGTTRYDLLNGFNNTSDGGSGTAGIADFSPVGVPVSVNRASTPAGEFTNVGDDRYEYCFAADTQVIMADGSSKAIQDIVAGEMVLAVPDTEPEAEARPCKVARVFHNKPARLWKVTFGGKTIRCTANHPFYVSGKGWIHAINLLTGDQLRTPEEKWTSVNSVMDSGETEAVFNCEVTGAHTYFVRPMDGGAVALVHNDSGPDYSNTSVSFWKKREGDYWYNPFSPNLGKNRESGFPATDEG